MRLPATVSNLQFTSLPVLACRSGPKKLIINIHDVVSAKGSLKGLTMTSAGEAESEVSFPINHKKPPPCS